MGILWTVSNPRVGFGVEAGFACLGILMMVRAGWRGGQVDD